MAQLGSKKSRKGCAQCKRRRVKCNEEAPCGNCIRRGEQCSLLAVSSPSTASDSRERDSSLPATTEEWVQDMELMHHYSSYVSRQLAAREDIQRIWQETIPNDAMKHTFLLHGLLALSALSMAHQRHTETSRYLAICDKHQNIALAGFRTALSGVITRDLSSALFAQASLTSVTSMSRSCTMASAMPSPKFLDMGDVAELFLLTRGVRDVIGVAYDYIAEGSLAVMFHGHTMPPAEQSKVILPHPVHSEFDRIQEMLRQHCESEHREHCAAALRDLLEIYRNVQYFAQCGAAEPESGPVMRWFTMVSMEFVRLVEQSHPPSLVVLAYFAAAMTSVRSVWWTENWSVYVLKGVEMTLDESMHHWLEWPHEQVRTGLAVLRGSA